MKLLPWNALAITGARSAITSIVIWVYLRHPRFTWSGAQIGGALTLALTQILFVSATQMTTAANAIFLQYSAPVFVALFGAWYLGERARPSDWLAMAAILGGMSLFLMDGLSAGGLVGSILAIIAGISMAWMILFMRKQKDGSPTETALLGNLIGAAVGLPFVFWEIGNGNPLGAQGIGIMLFLGIFQLGVPYITLFAGDSGPDGRGVHADPDAGADPQPALGLSRHRRTPEPTGLARRRHRADHRDADRAARQPGRAGRSRSLRLPTDASSQRAAGADNHPIRSLYAHR